MVSEGVSVSQLVACVRINGGGVGMEVLSGTDRLGNNKQPF